MMVTSTTSYASLVQYAKQEAQAYGVPEGLLIGQISAESGFNPNAMGYNRQNGQITSVDRGIAQINSVYQPQVSDAQAYNPQFGISWMAQKMAALHQEYGNWGAALQAYNSGQPSGDTGYVNSVSAHAQSMGYSISNLLETSGGSGGGSVSTPSTTSTPQSSTLAQSLLNSAQAAKSGMGLLSWFTNPGGVVQFGMTEFFGVFVALILIGVGIYALVQQSPQGRALTKTVVKAALT